MKKLSVMLVFIMLIFIIISQESTAAKTSVDNTVVRVNNLVDSMTLDEKVGQMVQGERLHVTNEDVTEYFLGSVLSGGGSSPKNGRIEHWKEMCTDYQNAAAATRLKIPIIYGIDAVHGHSTINGAVVYPHNIGLGAANNTHLMKEIGRATAEEMLLSQVNWNFGPCVAVARNEKWGRTYESYSENPYIVSKLAVPYIKALQKTGIVATTKHFIADGGTEWGTSQKFEIDQGDVQITEKELRRIYLPPYEKAIKSGVKSVMVSFNSINGLKCHENKKLITDLLKGELSFGGFVVSDFEGHKQINKNTYHEQVITTINTGIDMLMEPYNWKEAIASIKLGVKNNEISNKRIDDAVKRIIKVKMDMGLFENPTGNQNNAASELGLEKNKKIARQAVREQLQR